MGSGLGMENGELIQSAPNLVSYTCEIHHHHHSHFESCSCCSSLFFFHFPSLSDLVTHLIFRLHILYYPSDIVIHSPLALIRLSNTLGYCQLLFSSILLYRLFYCLFINFRNRLKALFINVSHSRARLRGFFYLIQVALYSLLLLEYRASRNGRFALHHHSLRKGERLLWEKRYRSPIR
jgi:hypothetical protein